MKSTRKNPTPERAEPQRESGSRRSAPADLQPPPTGASRGSPAAPVMKQFQKTKAESSGRS